jgi:hypothetical protein
VQSRSAHQLTTRWNCYFASYALAELTLPTPSFFLTLLENYGLQLHHPTSHAIILVVIFAYFCEMCVGV